MKFHVQSTTITPDIPVLQMGFSSRTHKSVGVHDDPCVSVVILQANETIVIIALDLVYGDRSFAGSLKTALREAFGLKPDQILISYSHTHSTVAVTGDDDASRSTYAYHLARDHFAWDSLEPNGDFTEDIRYYRMIRQKVLDLVGEGLANPIEGTVSLARAQSDFGVSRRLPVDGKVLWQPNFDPAERDSDLFLLKFTDRADLLRGLIYSYACHPTTLGPDNYLLSADFPGAVRQILTSRYPGLVPVFLQGCGADIKPAITADNGRFRSCNFAQLEQASRTLADDIGQGLATLDWRPINGPFAVSGSDVRLYTEIWTDTQWQSILDDPQEPTYRKNSIRQTLQNRSAKGIASYLPYHLSCLRLDRRTCLVGLECEVVNAIGKTIKQLFSEDVIVLGYTNSSACYIPSRQVLLGGGYERDSFMSAHLAGPFVPEVEDIIVGRAAQMVVAGRPEPAGATGSL